MMFFTVLKESLNLLNKVENFQYKIVLSSKISVLLLLYNILITITQGLLQIVGSLNPKIRFFLIQQKQIFSQLTKITHLPNRIIWVHTVSLGEFEQGLPVIKRLKAKYPSHKILVSFFSTSRHEAKMNSHEAHYIVYLPLDTQNNVVRFLDLIKPEMVFFVKSEFWPNYLNELKNRDIPTFLISATFRPSQAFFKPYGRFFRSQLCAFSHIFVQNETSGKLLESIGFKNFSVIGDSRIDRVSEFPERNNTLGFVEQFLDRKPCIVFGNSWPEDESIYLSYINKTKQNTKFIIVPRYNTRKNITNLLNNIDKKTVLYSERLGKDLSQYQVLIVDTSGLLSKIYSYAQVAYVGGGMVINELHNVLEPAAYGIPIVIGKHFKKFNEAIDLVDRGGVISITTKAHFKTVVDLLLSHSVKANAMGIINSTYISENKGATKKVITTIEKQKVATSIM